MLTQLANVLGEIRPVTRTYADGSADCPWCNHPMGPTETECRNPWCEAFPQSGPETILERRRKLAVRQAEEDVRRRNRALSAQYAKESRESAERWRAAQLAECDRRGCCRACLFTSGGRLKFIRHRGECPKL